MMLGGDHRILRTAPLDQIRPGRGVVVVRCEPVQLLHVIAVADLLVVEAPAFVHPVHTVVLPAILTTRANLVAILFEDLGTSLKTVIGFA